MADKAIQDLNTAPGSINDSNTLFVVSQAGTAYKVDGNSFVSALATILDGHGGVKSITYTAPVAPSLTGTMVVTLADNSTTSLSIQNGKGIASIAKTGSTGTPVVDTYTITYNDNTTSTFSVTNGAKGETGDAWYVWIKYAGQQPTSDADMGDTPDDWIGIYSGTSSTQPAHYTDYEWFQIKGDQGDPGASATLTTQEVRYQTSSSGTVAPSGAWLSNIPTVVAGDFLWTRTQLQFNTGNVITAYSVSRYGIDGTGSVTTVNNVSPGSNGNVSLTANDIPMTDNQSVQGHIGGLETDVGDVSNLTTSASTVVPAINELKTAIGNIWSTIYPVGSIYMSVDSTSPASKFGGTWERIKDTFLLSAGDTYTAGVTGGSATKNLQHKHTTGGHTLVESELPNITGYFDVKRILSGSTQVPIITTTAGHFTGNDQGTKTNNAGTRSAITDGVGDRITFSFGSNGSHSHGDTGNAASTTQDIMPPYLAVYVWKRTA